MKKSKDLKSKAYEMSEAEKQMTDKKILKQLLVIYNLNMPVRIVVIILQVRIVLLFQRQ